MSDASSGIDQSIFKSYTARLLLAGGLVLLLQFPILLIGGLTWERQSRRDAAVEEVSAKWGHRQTVTGPALVLPYVRRWVEVAANGTQTTRTQLRTAVFLPERLHVRGKVDALTRHRGIFSIPVYRLDLSVEGEFERPDIGALGIESSEVQWERAHVAVGIADARAIQSETALIWDGVESPFLPGTAGYGQAATGIHAPVEIADRDRIPFSFPLVANGSVGLSFAPFGRNTVVELEASSPSPSFQGNWLPNEYETTPSSFRAKWSIPFLGRNYPQAWSNDGDGKPVTAAEIDQSRFGFELLHPVDHYRMASRSLKYSALFLLLAFAAVWLTEVLAGIAAHPIQYLMLGCGLCLFYLLELALSEHLGFPMAYVLAKAAVVAMVAGFSSVVLRRTGRALAMSAGMGGLYLYLYMLLMNEDYALLIGSIGLFVLLAFVMYVTRNVNWYLLGHPGGAADQPQGPPGTAY